MQLSSWITILLVGLMAVGCFDESEEGDPLVGLSDDFEGGTLDPAWRRAYRDEGWLNDQLFRLEIVDGQLVVEPRSTAWFQDLRGPLVFRLVTGNFMVTTRVTVTGRDGSSFPQEPPSLGGVMARVPRDITPNTWVPGERTTCR